MATLSPLIEYLLAAQRQGGGGYLCRLGAIQTVIPIFPPNLSISWEIYPEFDSYANITFHFAFSGKTPPNSFDIEFYAGGVQVQSGPLTDLWLGHEGHGTYMVRTESNPMKQIMINTSGLSQYLEATEQFIIVDSEADYKLVLALIEEWNISTNQRSLQEETNNLLRQLVASNRMNL